MGFGFSPHRLGINAAIVCLLLAFLSLTGIQCEAQQLPESSPSVAALQDLTSNQKWHWYEPEESAVNTLLSTPGWRVMDSPITQSEWKWLSFAAQDGSGFLSLGIYHGLVGTLKFGYPSRADGGDWITKNAQQDGPGSWKDESNNATITRLYNGDLIIYKVQYYPFITSQ